MKELNKLNLKRVLHKLGVQDGSIIYITGNLRNLGFPESQEYQRITGKKNILSFYLEAILETVGKNGTIVFPTHTFDLVGSDKVFNLQNTPTKYTLSEYLRTNLEVRRQIHPYASIAAFGKHSKEIISDKITKHPYGIDSPYNFFENNKCIFISLGILAREAISAVHYCEFKAGVPYRYTKSFKHRIIVNGYESLEEFFLFVWYRHVRILRDKNLKIFSLEKIKNNLKREQIGSSFIESIPLNVFISETSKAMLEDPYIWTREIEEINGPLPWNV